MQESRLKVNIFSLYLQNYSFNFNLNSLKKKKKITRDNKWNRAKKKSKIKMNGHDSIKTSLHHNKLKP